MQSSEQLFAGLLEQRSPLFLIQKELHFSKMTPRANGSTSQRDKRA
jgi:hypothetical protein